MARPLVRLAGTFLALAGFGYVVWRFAQAGVWQQVSGSPYALHLLGMAMAGAPIYFVGLCAMTLAWWCTQAAFMPSRPPVRPLFAVFAATQFAKYLPGNIGHFVGRHVMLRRYGMGHAALLGGTLADAAFQLCAALVWVAGNVTVLVPALRIDITPWEVLLLEATGLLLLIGLLRRLRAGGSKLSERLSLHQPAWLLASLPMHLVLFGFMAVALMLSAHVLPIDAKGIWLLPGAAATSWVAGFLVIGAPAGLGVREAVFIALLHGHLPEADILLLAAAFRITTFSGDILLLLFGLLLGSGRMQQGQQAHASRA